MSLREDPTHSTLVLIAQLLAHHGMSLDMIKSWGGSVHAIGGPGDKRRLNGVRDGSLDIIAIATETAPSEKNCAMMRKGVPELNGSESSETSRPRAPPRPGTS